MSEQRQRTLERLLLGKPGTGRPERIERLLVWSIPFWLVAVLLEDALPAAIRLVPLWGTVSTAAALAVFGICELVRAGPAVHLRLHPLRTLFDVGGAIGIGLALPGILPLVPTVVLLLSVELIGVGFSTLTQVGAKSSSPARLLVMSFLFLIVAGALALSAPGMASTTKGALSLDEAVFTAVSAACVTGLTVIDVARDLSHEGQLVLLVLIQLGGLGLMTIGTLVLFVLDKASRARGQSVLGGMLGARSPGHVMRIAGLILLITFGFEALGALALGLLLGDLWLGLFCSVSAFCNAGFFPGSTSLVPWAGSFGVNIVVILLVVLGGLGFPVLIELGGRLLRTRGREPAKRLSLMSRLVLVTTAILILAGAVLWFLLQWERSLRGLGTGDGVMASLFQSVTMRTAGFNTVPMTLEGEEGLGGATLLVMCAFMAIGASPLGTGGGLKTVTFAILLIGVISVVRGRKEMSVYRRRIGSDSLLRAAAVFVIYTTTLILLGIVVMALEPDLPFAALFFETASALGTVGLSTGVTPELGVPARGVIGIGMLLGRVGPLSFFLWFAARETSGVSYPEEPLVVA